MKTPKIVYGLMIFTALTLPGCENSPTSSPSTYTERTVSGTLNLSSQNRLSPQELSSQLNNYMVWFQNIGSRRVYFSELDESGGFTLPIETTEDISNGDDFIAVIVSKSPFRMVGTIMGAPEESDTTAKTGLSISANISDLTIDFDPSKARATLNAAQLPTGLDLEDELEARLDDDGKPVGVEGFGKSEDAKTSDLNSKFTVDQDQDGTPDIFDAMNNGSILDNGVADASLETTVFSDSLSSLVMFMNLKIDQTDENTFSVADDGLFVIDVQANNPDDIDSIVAYLRHENYEDATLDRIPGGMTAVDTWGAEGSLWSDDGYKLYKVLNQEETPSWTVLFNSNTEDVTPGDLVLLKVTLSSGDIEYYWTSFNFKFNTIPFENSTWALGGDGSRDNPYIIPDTGDLDLTWLEPTDETGAVLTGLDYQLETFHYDNAEPENQLGSRQVVDLSEDVLAGTLPEEVIDENDDLNPAFMQVDITARYDHGDNTAIKIYLKRLSW